MRVVELAQVIHQLLRASHGESGNHRRAAALGVGQFVAGITGATDIEVLSGLKEGDQIVTGSYQVIRTIRNETQVKVDNKLPVTTPTT